MKNRNIFSKLGLIGLLGLNTSDPNSVQASYKPNIPRQKIEFILDDFNKQESNDIYSTYFTYEEWIKAQESNDILDKINLSIKASGINALKDLSYELLSKEERKEYKELWEIFDLDDSKYSKDNFYDRLNLQEIYAQQKRLKELFNFEFDFHKPSVGEKVIIFKDILYQRQYQKEKKK
ncbi:MAG: hypothetical protein WC867_01150 [Candidatus Pacearchaeota archaeon]|jgi:hypothetical protein